MIVIVVVDGVEVEADTSGRLGVVRYPEEQSALCSVMHLSKGDFAHPDRSQ